MKRTISLLVGIMIAGLIPCTPALALEQNSWTAESRTVVIEVEKGELIAVDDFTSDLEEYPEHEELMDIEEGIKTPYDPEDSSTVADEEVEEFIPAEPDRDEHISTDEEDLEEQIEQIEIDVVAVSEPIEIPSSTSSPEPEEQIPVEIIEDGSPEEEGLEDETIDHTEHVDAESDEPAADTMPTDEPDKNGAEAVEDNDVPMPTEESISSDDDQEYDQEYIEKTGSTEGEDISNE